MQPIDDSTEYDVVVMGGALAGSSMGLLIKRAHPTARVLVVERSTEFDFKVGESTSEIAGCFLSRVLRLGSWLSREQITKNGLRFWFNRDGNYNLGRCAEMGPKLQVRLPAWQLDRSTLDPHVLQLAKDAGCEIWRPATVRAFSLDGFGKNVLSINSENGEIASVRAKWVIDATGKAALIGRKRGTLEMLDAHPTNSMWARFRHISDLDHHDLITKHPEMAQRVWSQRATATNHLTGYGWWAWIIPLRGGEVSVGVTWDRRLYQPPTEGSIPERLRALLSSHPIGAYMMQHAEAVEKDARTYTQLAYFNREVAAPGWIAVGDAAGFMDPLYSHGIDFIAHTVWAASRIVIRSLDGSDVTPDVEAYAKGYQESYHRWFESLYKDKYHYLGDAELMYAATLMDVGFYFWGPVRLTYENHAKELALMPYNGPAGKMVARVMRTYNRRLSTLARRRLACGMYGHKNLDHHFLYRESFLPSHKVLGLIYCGMKQWLKCELSTWWACHGKTIDSPEAMPSEQQLPESTPMAHAMPVGKIAGKI